MGDLLASNCDHGQYHKKYSTINFAVPSTNAVTRFTPNSYLPKYLKLGITNEAIWLKSAQQDKAFVLSVDGKMVALYVRTK